MVSDSRRGLGNTSFSRQMMFKLCFVHILEDGTPGAVTSFYLLGHQHYHHHRKGSSTSSLPRGRRVFEPTWTVLWFSMPLMSRNRGNRRTRAAWVTNPQEECLGVEDIMVGGVAVGLCRSLQKRVGVLCRELLAYLTPFAALEFGKTEK